MQRAVKVNVCRVDELHEGSSVSWRRDDAARTGPCRQVSFRPPPDLPRHARRVPNRIAPPVASGSGWYLKADNDMRSASVRTVGKHAIPMRIAIVPQCDRETTKPRH
ncbi:hypothetical protein P355_1223 [Burkholderia cenocepacia KC-01]|nr:hypothetical protein P355_1223 [Burkholderia cenocepacia KC-01]